MFTPIVRYAFTLVPGLLLSVAATRAPAQAKVDAKVVAPNEQDLAYYLSPKGVNLVAITQRGSRFVVLHNGEAGPPFDAILLIGPSRRVAFSDDGARFGYVARLGQEWVVMVDGKEVLRRPIGSNDAIKRGGGPSLRFSPRGRHWFLHYHNLSAATPMEDPDRFTVATETPSSSAVSGTESPAK